MAEALQSSEEQPPEQGPEIDGALLKLEQALHRREALIVVTSPEGRSHSSLVRTALARFDEAYVVVLISPANAEPILALDRLLETAGQEIANATVEEKQAALSGLMDRAGELGRPVVVVVDDAQLATVAQLERLRTALNIDPGARRPVQLVLAGTHALVAMLKSREARGLWTRVTAHIDVPGEGEETERPEEDFSAVTVNERPASRRRWPLVTLASAGVLTAALLVLASLARDNGAEPSKGPVTAIEPARPARVNAPSSAKPATPSSPTAESAAVDRGAPAATADNKAPAIATGQPDGAAPQASAPATQQAAAESAPAPLKADALATGAEETPPPAAPATVGRPADAVASGSVTPPTPSAARVAQGPPGLLPPGQQASAEATPPPSGAVQAPAGPKVSEWMGVETIRGSGVPSSSAGAPAPAASAPAASAEEAAQPQRGAQVVVVEPGAPAAEQSPAMVARAAVAADMAKATGDAPPAGASAPSATTQSAASAGASSSPTPSDPATAAASPPSENAPTAASATPPSSNAASTEAAGAPVAAGGQAAAASAPGSPASPSSPTTASSAASSSPQAASQAAAQQQSAIAAVRAATARPQPAADETSKPAIAAKPAPQPVPAAVAAASRPTAGFEIQLGAFRTMANASKVRDEVRAEFPTARIDPIKVNGIEWFRVRVGPFNTRETADAETRLRSLGFTPVRFNASIKAG